MALVLELKGIVIFSQRKGGGGQIISACAYNYPAFPLEIKNGSVLQMSPGYAGQGEVLSSADATPQPPSDSHPAGTWAASEPDVRTLARAHAGVAISIYMIYPISLCFYFLFT